MDARAHEGEEARAASIALGGTPRERLRVSTRALTKLLRDPDDTRQVFLLGLTANRRAFPEFLARFAFERDGAELLASQPSIDSAAVDWAALRAMPDGTLGREYVRYLDDNHLDPDLFQAPPPCGENGKGDGAGGRPVRPRIGSGSMPPRARDAARADPDGLPDVRDGLTRTERIVLHELWKLERERPGRNVPMVMLYGRVVEHVDITPEALSELVARLGARRP